MSFIQYMIHDYYNQAFYFMFKKKLSRPGEAMAHFQRAAELQSQVRVEFCLHDIQYHQ